MCNFCFEIKTDVELTPTSFTLAPKSINNLRAS